MTCSPMLSGFVRMYAERRGFQTVVMDLHQGSNEYVPARPKPMTAAMQQDKKHIEGSVYDPRTGQTVVR